MKILFHSNAMHGKTGYGVQTALFVPRLQALGHEVTVSAIYGIQGAPMRQNGVLTLPAPPSGIDSYGGDTLPADAEFVDADVVISLIDVWVMEGRATSRINWYPMTPVDHSPLPPAVKEYLMPARQPIAFSQFGVRELRAAGFDPLYVPLAVDTKVFTPRDKKEARQALGCPEDAFLVGIVAANVGAPSRKAFDQQIRSFARFREDHPNAMLYLHTELHGRRGEPLNKIIQMCGLPREAIGTVDQYRYARGMLNSDDMATAYSAMDVLLSATRGEGFGVPIIESQSCGTPVIVTDFSAMPDLVPAGTGWRVPVDEDDWFFTDQRSYQVIPKVSKIVEALEKAYAVTGDETMAAFTRQHALAYDADHVTGHYWQPVLEEIEAELPAPLNPVCAEQGHNWSKVGVYVENELVVHCHRCPAERRRDRDGWQESVGEGTRVHGISLDLEDDPDGGVVEVVREELRNTYDLDSIPFRPGDVVLDLGAHVGVVSIYLAKRHPEIGIIAFEPVPENFKRLERNLAAHRVANVIPVPAAVTGDGEVVTLYGRLDNNSGGASAFVPNGGVAYQAPALTLAQIFERYRLSRVRLLKLDVEGAEYDILEAGADYLSRVDYLRAEFHTSPRLTREGKVPELLYELCVQHLDPAHVKVHGCALG
jgi:FkbM family methyltransferase